MKGCLFIYMKKSLRKILGLFTPSEKKQMLLLMGAILVMAIFEVVGVASIMPFMAVLANSDVITTNHVLSWVYGRFSFQTTNGYLIFLGVIVLVLMVFSNAFTAFTMKKMLRFTYMRNYTLAKRLLINYVSRPYQFFLNRNSTELGKNILSEVSIVIFGVLIPGMQMLAKTTVSVALIAGIFVVDPVLAGVMFGVTGGIYYLVYTIMTKKIAHIGAARTEANRVQHQLASELFGGIKDIKLLGMESEFIRRFSDCSERCAEYQVTHNEIAIFPRYVMESIIFGCIIIIVLYYLVALGGVKQVLPTLAFFGLAGYRLMPSIQQIFSSLTTFQFYHSAVAVLYNDLQSSDSSLNFPNECLTLKSDVKPIRIQRTIVLQNISFAYYGSEKNILNDVSLVIPRNKTIAFVGVTGSGKTTLVDIILGLISPCNGHVFVDDIELGFGNMRAWQNGLGYIPQQIYLSDDSIRRNIAFGLPDEMIDDKQVEKVAQIAHIHEFVIGLPGGYDTKVGERGVRLSGGQRQRIGIARALYHTPDVLVMDEATSALDGETESVVMQAIDELSHQMTIIIVAHRLSTVEQCDKIYLLDAGRVVAHGTYDELAKANKWFRELAAHSNGKNRETIQIL